MFRSPSPPLFAADMMLGRLARWMRILDYDVLYRDPIDDAALIALAAQEARVLLTRDTRLVRRKGVGDYLLIQNNDPLAQLEEVVRVYPPMPGRILQRCLRCNTPLCTVAKKEVENQVPEYTYRTEPSFGKCPGCGRVYWKGTHCRQMVATCRTVMGEKDSFFI